MSPLKPTSQDSSDPLTSLLTLEDTLYKTAYTSGQTAGSHAGRIEGRIFGLENAFEKFSSLGKLHGRSVVWAARALPNSSTTLGTEVGRKEDEHEHTQTMLLRRLTHNSRLVNNITLLHSLTDTQTFSTENTEDAVADFDDRFKRAGAKAKVIERIVGVGEAEEKSPRGGSSPAARAGKTNKVVLGEKKKKSESGKKRDDDNMEDFAGSRLLR